MSSDGDSESEKVSEYQKWTHVNLSDFRSKSCWTGFSYFWLWFLAFIGIAVYAADTFTAVNLLAFDHWPGQIQPAIPFNVSRWLFAACIIFSWVLCFYEWYRAVKVMRRGSVAKDYLDPGAATLQSMRIGSQGWKRFLVFAQLTKSKKGVDYFALFAYFQFKGSIRVLLAEGPRQAINAITLYAVMKASLLPADASTNNSENFNQFWDNVRVLAREQPEHAVILFTMLFTLIIWCFSMLSLIAAALAWGCFLWHRIEGNLTHYCKRKIEKRLRKIVEGAFLKELERQRIREGKPPRRPLMGLFGGSGKSTPERRPTLPLVVDEKEDDSSTLTTTLTRKPTQSTLPPWTPQLSRKGTSSSTLPAPGLARQPTLPAIEESPLSFHATRFPAPSSGDAPHDSLVADAAPMSYSAPAPALAARGLVVVPRKPLPSQSKPLTGPIHQRFPPLRVSTTNAQLPGAATRVSRGPATGEAILFPTSTRSFSSPQAQQRQGSMQQGSYPPTRPYTPYRQGSGDDSIKPRAFGQVQADTAKPQPPLVVMTHTSTGAKRYSFDPVAAPLTSPEPRRQESEMRNTGGRSEGPTSFASMGL